MSIFDNYVYLIDVSDHAFDYVRNYLKNLMKKEEVAEYMLYVVDDYSLIQEVNY
jgi:hypothetical protein